MIDYELEPKRVIFCIDVKSFFASVECVERNYHPLKKMLVVMSKEENAGGLVLAATPRAKKILGISNVTRKYELPDHPDLEIVPPRMSLYIQKNHEINEIYRKYIAEEDLHIYSIDESFLDVTASLPMFHKNGFELAKMIQYHIWRKFKLYVSIGIGDNPLLAKLALDNEAKHNENYIAEWHYSDISEKLWNIHPMSEMWGIGRQTEKRLHRLGIDSINELAHTDPVILKESMGLIGEQLHAHANGIDRSRIAQKYTPLEKSYGNSQILNRDYTNQKEIEIVIREMADQVAARLRARHCQTACVHLSIGFSHDELKHGFSHQMKIPFTSQSIKLIDYCLQIFRTHYQNETVRQIGIAYSKLNYNEYLQLDLFENPEQQIANEKLDFLIDQIRNRYGYQSLIHASSMAKGGTAIERSKLVGGHQG